VLWNPYQGTVYDIVSSREIPIKRTATCEAQARCDIWFTQQVARRGFCIFKRTVCVLYCQYSVVCKILFAVMAVSRKTRGKSINAPRNKIENAVNKMTPEIYFARKLASNEKKIRDRSLKKLRRWIAARSAVPDGISTWCLFAFLNVF
jgi:hypothetical protein